MEQIALDTRVEELSKALNRLCLIARQDALLILRSSLGAPKMLYSLRCAPCVCHPALAEYDQRLRKGLENILNINLSESQWLQSTLPIGMGGLGVRRVSSLALPAFLASAAGTLVLQSDILRELGNQPDPQVVKLMAVWQADLGTNITEDFPTHIQSKWDKPLLQKTFSELFNPLIEKHDQARWRAITAQHAGDWLYSLPITSCGLRLSDEAMRVAVGLRLGASICEPHTCACGALVTARGEHGLSCSLGFGRVARHGVLNDLFYRALVKAGFPATKEPQGLLRSDGKRPDGITLIPWRAGRGLVWDATVVDTLAPSYLAASATRAGAAAGLAEDRKNQKYSALLDTHIFIPIAMETLGPINDKGLDFYLRPGTPSDTSNRRTQRLQLLIPAYLHYNTTLQRCCFQWFLH